MIYIFRIATVITLAISGITLIHPKSGWGRLVLFIPKLFAGTFILHIGILGVVSAIAGWIIFNDRISLGLGGCTTIILIRHIYRIIKRSQSTSQEIADSLPYKPKNTMLVYPWVVKWQEGSDIPWQKDVIIGQHAETGDTILADVWSSADPNNRSGLGIIYLHGSGWHYASKDFGTRHFFRHLARQGHVIIDVDYTLAPKTDLFGMVADVKRAITWVKENATKLGISPERIILMGGSAGGHLALLAAYTPNHPKFDPTDIKGDTSVRGVVSYYGPPDLRAQFGRFNELPGLTGSTKAERMFMSLMEARFGFEPIPVHGLLPKFLGGTPLDVPELYDIGSPIHHLGTHCPPTLLLQGTHDFSGAAPEVHKLLAELKTFACNAFMLELPDTDHGFDLYKPKWSPAAQAGTYVTDRFLVSLC